MNKQNKDTGISWTDRTWNCVIGCDQNCPDCYAAKMAWRLAEIENARFEEIMQYAPIGESTFGRKYSSGIVKKTGWTGKVFFNETVLEQPLHCKKPQKIFTVSMGDLLCKAVPSEWIEKVLKVVKKCPQHTFQFCTQNPARYSEFEWPDNCWLGTTIRIAAERMRLLELTKAKCKVRFISVEPCLESIEFRGYEEYVDWIIVGCASDYRTKDCKLEWIEGIVEQCKSAGVAPWVKQIYINGKVEKDISKFPKWAKVRQFPQIKE